MTLNELKPGECGIITAVGGEGPLRCRLLDMGIIPKTAVTLRKTAPMGDPIEIHLRGYDLTIRLDDSKNIEISPINDEGKDRT
ncbi:MAG: ferrous iron transport protein A [Oscillospiraceae bacterium]